MFIYNKFILLRFSPSFQFLCCIQRILCCIQILHVQLNSQEEKISQWSNFLLISICYYMLLQIILDYRSIDYRLQIINYQIICNYRSRFLYVNKRILFELINKSLAFNLITFQTKNPTFYCIIYIQIIYLIFLFIAFFIK